MFTNIVIVLCDGMARSGSTWSFNVALKLLKASEPQQKSFGLYDERVQVFRAAVRSRDSNLVIKAHTIAPEIRELSASRILKTIYTWRDPYDAVASFRNMFGFPVEETLNALRNALRVWAFHQATDSAFILPYSEIVTEPKEMIAAVATYLNLNLCAEQIEQISQEVSFEHVRKLSSGISALQSPRLVRSGDLTYDRETLFHQDHIRNGRIGYGLSELSPDLLEAIDSILLEEGFEYLARARDREPVGSTP